MKRKKRVRKRPSKPQTHKFGTFKVPRRHRVTGFHDWRPSFNRDDE